MIRFDLDERLLSRCDDRRRLELESALTDLNEELADAKLVNALSDGSESARIRIVLRSPKAATFEAWTDSSETALAAHHLLWVALKVPMKDYQAIIQRIASGGFSVRGRGSADGKFEALDYGKRIIHDEAGEEVVEQLEDFVELDLASARRLFTLLFLIRTELPADVVRYHRAHFDV